MFTLHQEQNTSCGSGRVLIGHAMSVISGFDIKIDSCRVYGAAVFVKASLETTRLAHALQTQSRMVEGRLAPLYLPR
jgi:hypothetical protein